MKSIISRNAWTILFMLIFSGFALADDETPSTQADSCELSLQPQNLQEGPNEAIAAAWKTATRLEQRRLEETAIIRHQSFIILKAHETLKGAFRDKDIREYINVGYLALRRTFEKFDPAKGANFLTYFSTWLRAFFIDEIIEKRFISKKVMKSTTELSRFYRAYKKAVKSLLQKAIKVDAESLSLEMGIPLDETFYKYYDAVRSSKKFIDISASVYGSPEGLTYSDILPDHNKSPSLIIHAMTIKNMSETMLDQLASELDPVQLALLERLLSHDPKTLIDIAKEYSRNPKALVATENVLKKKIKNALPISSSKELF